MLRRPMRVWHIAVAIGAIYIVAGILIQTIWQIDPWLFAALVFGGVLAL